MFEVTFQKTMLPIISYRSKKKIQGSISVKSDISTDSAYQLIIMYKLMPVFM